MRVDVNGTWMSLNTRPKYNFLVACFLLGSARHLVFCVTGCHYRAPKSEPHLFIQKMNLRSVALAALGSVRVLASPSQGEL